VHLARFDRTTFEVERDGDTLHVSNHMMVPIGCPKVRARLDPGQWRDAARQARYEVNWTKGTDQKTGKPVDCDPSLGIQIYTDFGNLNRSAPAQEGLRPAVGRQQLLTVIPQGEDWAYVHFGSVQRDCPAEC
jgi:hypothetical protein